MHHSFQEKLALVSGFTEELSLALQAQKSNMFTSTMTAEEYQRELTRKHEQDMTKISVNHSQQLQQLQSKNQHEIDQLIAEHRDLLRGEETILQNACNDTIASTHVQWCDDRQQAIVKLRKEGMYAAVAAADTPSGDLPLTLTTLPHDLPPLPLPVEADMARIEHDHALVIDTIRVELAEIAAECEGLMGEKNALVQQLQEARTGSRNDGSFLHSLSSSPHLWTHPNTRCRTPSPSHHTLVLSPNKPESETAADRIQDAEQQVAHLQKDVDITQQHNQTLLETIANRDEAVAQWESQVASQEQTFRDVDETFQRAKREMVGLREELGRYHQGGVAGVDLDMQGEEIHHGESSSGSGGGGSGGSGVGDMVVPNVMVSNLSGEVTHMSATALSLQEELQRQAQMGNAATAELRRAVEALTRERDAVRALVDESSRQVADRQQTSTDEHMLTQRQKSEHERRCRELLVREERTHTAKVFGSRTLTHTL